uniref:proteasome endopeptidase complex n=1 Tax=Phaeomonas parva TaxID=124430 RepID=A0A7S1TR76_9STRA|mmetsp:Transcript_14132/g.42266  ORF Transcript_14132/g.42266 Transcript_14132/m.42266 type:complete len:223 (+) Transcript_14132:120-788(+)
MEFLSGGGDPYGLKPNELSTGTTIMAAAFAGGVVVGADSRTSTGSYVANRVSDKLSPLSDFVYMCRSGSAADTQMISDQVRYYLASSQAESGRASRVKSAAALARNIGYRYKHQLSAAMIVAGWDPVEKGAVYSIPLGGTMLKQDYTIGGSGSTFITGYCDSQYRPGMTREECQVFVKTAISHAMARDGSSGGIIRLCTIDETGVTREYIPGDELPYPPESV